MSASDITVARWTKTSVVSTAAGAILLLALVFLPFVAGTATLDKVTTLFIYIMLAATWNALAGYGGLVSIGQQAFFGLSAYVTIRLSNYGFNVYLAILAAPIVVGIVALPISAPMLRLKAGEFAIGMWVLAELLHLLVNLDPLIQGETGTSLIALNAYDVGTRNAFTFWVALGAIAAVLIFLFTLLRSATGSALQSIRDNEEAAESVGVRVLTTKRIIFVFAAAGAAIAGSLWLATAISFQPKTYFSVQWTSYMIFMVLVGGTRNLRRRNPGCGYLLPDRIDLRECRRLVPDRPRCGGTVPVVVFAARALRQLQRPHRSSTSAGRLPACLPRSRKHPR